MCWVCKTVIKDSLFGWKRFMMLAFLPALVNFRKKNRVVDLIKATGHTRRK